MCDVEKIECENVNNTFSTLPRKALMMKKMAALTMYRLIKLNNLHRKSLNMIHLTSFFANTQVKFLLICLIAIDIDS